MSTDLWNKFDPEKSSFMRGLSEPFLADLGRVVAAWSIVEHDLDILFLRHVVRPSSKIAQDELRPMTLPFDKKMHAFKKRIAEMNLPVTLLKRVTSTLDKASTLRKERDKIAHSLWNISLKPSQSGMLIEQDVGVRMYQSWRKLLASQETREVTTEELREIFGRIHHLWFHLLILSLEGDFCDHRG